MPRATRPSPANEVGGGTGEVVTPDPVGETMYFHGDDTVQVSDDDTYAGETGGILPMDRTAPSDNSYETRQLVNHVQGPNARCAGNGLWPVWRGYVGEGQVTAVLDLDGVDPQTTMVVQLRPADGPARTEPPVDDPGPPCGPPRSRRTTRSHRRGSSTTAPTSCRTSRSPASPTR